jgi:sialidase-1
MDVFVAAADGVHTYRIPAMVVSPNGTLLVFCEARKQRISDGSPTDMVLRRSSDAGKSWSAMQVLIRGTGKEAVMNPCPVVDRSSNTIVLFCVSGHNPGQEPGHYRHLMITSSDDGQTWSKPVDLARRITPYDDTFVSGPGVGIQTSKGRLVIPGRAGVRDKSRTGSYSRVLFSDDQGRRWKMGDPVSAYTHESQVVELADGRLMLNMRDNTGQSCRAVATSDDGGQTWTTPSYDRALNECPCQASFIRYSRADQDDRSRLLFANPDVSGARYGVVKRTRMSIKLSYDEGKTWPIEKLIHAGPSSYSSMVRLPNGDIGLVYEGGRQHRREWIRFARVSLDWLTDGKDR